MTYEAVHKAIKRGDIDALRVAFKDTLDPNLDNKRGHTILMLAACKGNSKIGKLMIDAGADMNKRDAHRNTALSLAALTGSAAFVELLLENGASLDCYPHGSSLNSYLDWLTNFYPERMRRIRKAFDSARVTRALHVAQGESPD